jgi:murein DD-endopeptidase MepM/ murein hydrolase activator NlpD
MITLLLLTITAVTVFLYNLFGNKKYRNLIETTLSFVACCLLFQYLMSTADSLENHVRVLSVHSSPTPYYYNEDYRHSFESEDNNNLIEPTKASLNNNPASPPLYVEGKNVDKMPTCGSCSELDNDLHDNYDMQSQSFIWPATGKIIQSFHESGNDGINISVCSGTSVQATEGGEIAYAGEELAGYGKMVLIRHPNGFVSAYAHNSELNVRKGDKVKRGQVIAKSGQSGNVGSPQLHFELRRGSIPVDPIKFMPDNNSFIGSN